MFSSNRWNIAVIGLGYVGLPLAVHMAGKGMNVLGIDKDERKVKWLNNGKSYIPDVAKDDISRLKEAGRLSFSLPEERIKDADYIVVAVPTPLNARKKPDLSAVIGAASYIGQHLRKGQTIIFESSTYPGTLEEVVYPILSKESMMAGTDYYLGYSPERIDPGNHRFKLEQIPKVVSGMTSSCRKKVADLYSQLFNTVVPVNSPKAAELCKLFENIQRLVNISLVNEMEVLCRKMNIDFIEALKAASTKPFGFTPYYPGPGIGGHCIPVDPLYFQWKAGQFGYKSLLIDAACTINQRMPEEIVRRIEDSIETASPHHEKQKKVLLIGLTYKKDVNDTRESTAIEIMKLLAEQNFSVNYCDPYVPDIVIRGKRYVSKVLTATLLRQHDAVVILTDHSNIDWELVRRYAKAIVDTRGVLRSDVMKEGTS